MNSTRQIGFAGDFFVASERYFSLTGGVSRGGQNVLLTICDLFLLNDKVIFRADPFTILLLLETFSIEDIIELTKTQKVGFFLPKYHNTGHYKHESLENRIYNLIETRNRPYEKEHENEKWDSRKIIKIVFDNLLEEKTKETFEDFEIEMTKLFVQSFDEGSIISWDTQNAFEQGMAKIRELWSVGVNSIYYDWEFNYFLDRCDKVAYLRNKNLKVKPVNPNHSILDDLHCFKNIPSIAELIYQSDKPTELFIDIINSVEAHDFRNWIKQTSEKSIDVRDFYMKSVSKLPAKNKWVDWLRFGSVSVISTILGTIISANPIIGFTVGTGVGVADKILGDKALNSTSNNYNPDSWINFIQRKT